MWSIAEYCAAQQPSDWASLPESSQEFLQALNLTSLHPFCQEDATPFELEDVPPMGPLVNRFEGQSALSTVYTIWRMISPPLLAMGELWLRLFGAVLGPIGILYLVAEEMRTPKNSDVKSVYIQRRNLSIACILTVASTLVLMTDTLYVLARGPLHGVFLFVVATTLASRVCLRHNLVKVSVCVWLMVLLAVHLVWDYDTDTLQFGNADDEVRISEGLYYDSSNEYVSNIVSKWPEFYRSYSTQTGATVWMPSGDSRTGLPFLLNKVERAAFTRVYLPTLEDDEVLAVDIAFPASGHDPSHPLYMVLHGLNGGSDEEYVQEFVHRRTAEGSTVAVMIARGLMDLPIRGWNNFHGARTVDAHATALALREAKGPSQVLSAVGFSMGAIVLSNYVASYGAKCALDAAVSISGGLDMRPQEYFARAKRLWQPMLAETLRDVFLIEKWGERVKARLSPENFLRLLRASDVTEVDDSAVVQYHGFYNLKHYYSEMGAMGDIPESESGLLEEENSGKIHNVSIPLCVVHALDDPLITWKTVANNEGFMHPDNLSRTGSGNLVLLLTKGGGHVGWPVGFLPFVEKWAWMNNLASSFAIAVQQTKFSEAP